MNTHYVLIDYENVQPRDLALLQGGSFVVKVFIGPAQGRIPLASAMALQALGDKAEYVPVATAGHNALDFHIAYYIGRLSAQDPSGVFHIISKDSGFDALIRHLAGKGTVVSRSASIASMTNLTPLPSLEDQVSIAVSDLLRRASSRPRTKKTLLSTLNSLFRRQLTEERLSVLLDSLCAQGMVRIEGTKVAYHLPTGEGTGEGTVGPKGTGP